MTNTPPSFPGVTPFTRLVQEQCQRDREMYRDVREHATVEHVLTRIHGHAVNAAAHLAVEQRKRSVAQRNEEPLADYQALAHELVRLTGLAMQSEPARSQDTESVVNLAIARDPQLAASCAAGDGVCRAREDLASVAILAWQELQRTQVGSRPTVMAVYVFAHVLGEGLELA